MAWAAGIVDGEGSIFVTRWKDERRKCSTHQMTVSVVATSEAMILRLREIAGDGRIVPVSPRSVRHRPVWKWALDNRRAAEFLERVLPYLVVKADQARLGIEFASGIAVHGGGRGKFVDPAEDARRADLQSRLRVLNGREVA